MKTPMQSKLRNPHGNLAEFGPVLFVFFILILLPLANLIFYSIGVVGTQYLVSEAARAASAADTRAKANTAMSDKARACLGTGILMIAKVRPVGGFAGQGCTLYCKKIPLGGGNPATFDLTNVMPVADRPDTGTNANNFLYEYTISGQYQVFPLIDMSPVPLVGSIPAVAGPSTVTFAVSNSVENPKALDN